MKYLKHFANAQEAATVLATWPFNTISSIEGQSGVHYSEGVTPPMPSDEIWYTTTDNVAIDLESWETLSFGNVSPISSIYSDGKGIVKFNGDLTTVGGYGGDYFETLQTVELPDSITILADDCLSSCEALTSINIPNGVTTIGDYALSYTGLTSINIPASVTSIGSHVLYNFGDDFSITVDSNNQYYDSRNNCNAIIDSSTNTLITGCKNSTIPNGVVKIYDGVFNSLPLSGDLIIPDSVAEIGNTAFAYCTGLTSVHIGTGITKIDADAFDGCTGLNSITVLATNPPQFSSEGVFDNTNNCPIYVPASAFDTYKANDRWNGWYGSRIQALPTEIE